MTAPVAVPSPPTEHLSPAYLDGLRAALEEELRAQHAQAVELEATVEALTGQSDTDSLLERELAERGHHRTLEAIAEIQQAVRRIEAGTYGRCERCGGPIAAERLEAIPFTRHCVGCPPPSPSLIG